MNVFLNHLIKQCIEHGVIKSEDADTYRYGFDLLIFSLINMSLLIFVGFVIGRANMAILILLGYIPLQSLGGGYHATSHLRCSMMMLFDMGIALLAVEFVSIALLTAGACISIVGIFLLAPVQHPNAPFGPIFAKRMRFLVRLFSSVIFIVMIFAMEGHSALSSCIAMSLILSGVSLCLATLKSKCAFHSKPYF